MKAHFITRGADVGACEKWLHWPAGNLTTAVSVTPVHPTGEEPVVSGTKGTIMRWFVLSTMLIVIAVSASSDAASTLGKSMRLPVNPQEALAGHPVVGSWSEVTEAGVIPVDFYADGTVTMRFPDVILGNQGNSFISGGTGTWQPVGQQAAVYTVVRMVSHANGIDLGTITIQGYLKVSMDGTTFTDDGLLTIVTTRDARGAINSVTGTNSSAPPSIATRVVAVANPASGLATHSTNRFGPR
jgi:hypothetical protein